MSYSDIAEANIQRISQIHYMKTIPTLCLVLTSISPTVADSVDSTNYLHSERGLRAYHLKEAELSDSLKKAMSPHLQSSSRTAGSPTHTLIRKQNEHIAQTRNWFSSKPLKMMPYLDSVFVFGNTCVQPNALMKDDGISTFAQRIKSNLSQYGFTYSLQYGVNYTGLTGAHLHGRKDFFSHNGSLLSNLTIYRNEAGGGLFLATEFDFGNGFHFNEDSESPSKTLGSLQNPTSSFQGPDPHISNLSLAWVSNDSKLLIMGGQLDTSNYLDHNSYSNSHYNNLTNSVFTNNPVLPLTDNSLGMLVAWQPTKNFYLMATSAANNVSQNQNPFKYFSHSNWSSMLELGICSDDTCGLGSGVYRLQPFLNTCNNETGVGIGLNIQQQLGKQSHLGWFLRAGIADTQAANLTGVRSSISTGLVWLSPFSGTNASNDGYLGLGFLWQQANKNLNYTNKNEYGVELTYVVQVTPTLTIQPDIQLIHNPIYGKKGQTNLVFQIQKIWTW